MADSPAGSSKKERAAQLKKERAERAHQQKQNDAEEKRRRAEAKAAEAKAADERKASLKARAVEQTGGGRRLSEGAPSSAAASVVESAATDKSKKDTTTGPPVKMDKDVEVVADDEDDDDDDDDGATTHGRTPAVKVKPAEKVGVGAVKAYVNNYASKDEWHARDMNGRPAVWARIMRAAVDGKGSSKKKGSVKRLFLLDTGAGIARIPETWNEDFLHCERGDTVRIKNRADGDRFTVRLLVSPVDSTLMKKRSAADDAGDDADDDEGADDEVCTVELTASVTQRPANWTKEQDDALREAMKKVVGRGVGGSAALAAAFTAATKANPDRYKQLSAHVKGQTNAKCQQRVKQMRSTPDHGILGVDFINAIGWDAIRFGYDPKAPPVSASPVKSPAAPSAGPSVPVHPHEAGSCFRQSTQTWYDC